MCLYLVLTLIWLVLVHCHFLIPECFLRLNAVCAWDLPMSLNHACCKIVTYYKIAPAAGELRLRRLLWRTINRTYLNTFFLFYLTIKRSQRALCNVSINIPFLFSDIEQNGVTSERVVPRPECLGDRGVWSHGESFDREASLQRARCRLRLRTRALQARQVAGITHRRHVETACT